MLKLFWILSQDFKGIKSEIAVKAVAEGAFSGLYQFEKYRNKSKSEEKDPKILKIITKDIKKASKIVKRCCNYCRFSTFCPGSG